MTSEDQRRELRFACHIPAILKRGKRSIDVVTEDVSFRGLSLRVDPPPAVRQLVEVDMQLPPDERRVRLHGMVVYVITAGGNAERAHGIGVELRGLTGEARAGWETFVRFVQLQARAGDGHKRGSVRERADADAPAMSVSEDEVSEETLDSWEDEETTDVWALPGPQAPRK